MPQLTEQFIYVFVDLPLKFLTRVEVDRVLYLFVELSLKLLTRVSVDRIIYLFIRWPALKIP